VNAELIFDTFDV